ncbi:DUF3616 domain-containing protein [Salinarimonas soli]|uniref:DUF3616 domain-containing protein n=1 Tax=Salinarimonas soli TaxID=1638099 RepID=A0A5B2V9K5_9HYPH|nr:DUF3616 domain-containing protein [Salinarimonas soli]KAA2235691.1 DUF3616 domain-containing protein [Salinarimonas soli]
MPQTAPVSHQVALAFHDWRPLRHVEDPLHKDLSAVARAGDSLFVACDETASVERLSRQPDGSYGAHAHFALDAFFDLPEGDGGEMDIEGLCANGGYLWIVGSHSLKRAKPKGEDDGKSAEALERMERIEREPNRFFLGRIPLIEERPGLFTPVARGGERRPASARCGQKRGALERWLRRDAHLAPFLDIPSKENGFDVEGLAVRGDRVWLGLRGPVLRGHAVVIEMTLKVTSKGRLKARRIDGRRYRKHLLDTRGLGIRDMRLDGEDLLLLVGPTMSIEGPAYVLRWRGAARQDVAGVVDPDRIREVAELPYRLHADHPEGLELWPEAGPDALLVIYDAPAPERVDPERFTVQADVICTETRRSGGLLHRRTR